MIKSMEVIFSKLRNLTQIKSGSFLIDEHYQIKQELVETPNIAQDEYHNKNQELTLKLRLTLRLDDKDREYLGELKYLLKDTPRGRRQPSDGD